MRYLFSFLPVIVFLLALKSMDSYKLVRFRAIVLALLAGVVFALLSMVINRSLIATISIETADYSKYIAPIVEESLKSVYIAYLIASRRTGFLVDAAIFGFAVGAGFAIIENSYYIIALGNNNPLISIIRGFGPAIMHGGTTAILAIVAKNIFDRKSSHSFSFIFPALLPAVVIHSIFNHFLVSPVISAAGLVIILPSLMIAVFTRSERSLSRWLGIGFDADADMLEMITTGQILDSHVGKYLISLKNNFSGEVLADMLCLLRIHLELSIRAKGLLLMKESGFTPPPDPELKEKFVELNYLKSNIGGTGMLAMHPLLRWSSRDLWQMHMLENH
ncbi:MAG: PrsW family intramembrane metalloprotease [Candidatus Krumholzibacteriota bacterium]|nr:PrsW family intramembrane metalloprotease [Candidatus Krumholzibacteriota bacterium]